MSNVPTEAWIGFGLSLAVFLAIDLFVHRGAREDSHRSAIVWSAVWIAVGLLFGLVVWAVEDGDSAADYYAAYLLEKSLSVDNLFVFLLVFQSLGIHKRFQKTVLFWGILGALVFRGLFVWLGAAALERWTWVNYIFGGLLLVAAYRSFRTDPAQRQRSRVVAWLSKHLPVTHRIHGDAFVATEHGERVATPLLVALIALELTDFLFAIDSVPAAFSVTRNAFLVYSSNAFALLGLRALYIVLAKSLTDLHYLHYGLAGVLAFAAVKLILSEWLHIPAWASIGVIGVMIGTAVVASVRQRTKTREFEPTQAPQDSRRERGHRRERRCAH